MTKVTEKDSFLPNHDSVLHENPEMIEKNISWPCQFQKSSCFPKIFFRGAGMKTLTFAVNVYHGNPTSIETEILI